jgi:transposase
MKREFIKQNVGIDVSKDDFKVSLSWLTSDFQVIVRGSRTFPNNQCGFEKLQDWVLSKSAANLPLSFTLEATGVYYEGLAYFLHRQNYFVHVVLPNQAKKYGQSLGIKSKTDKIDAQTLAQLGLKQELRIWQPISPHLLGLKQLTREREALVRSKTMACNHLHAYAHQGKPNADSITRTRQHIVFLEGQIKQIEKEIKNFVARDKSLKTRIAYLTSIPGVGLLTAVIIVAETGGFETFENIKQLTSYAGLDVRIQESGKWRGKTKISKQGNSHIRKALYMPSISKKGCDYRTKQFYERLVEKKGNNMVALIAVERKLLGVMYSLWKKQEMYSPAA